MECHTLVSSVHNTRQSEFSPSGKSFIKRKNVIGLCMDPCGTPDVTLTGLKDVILYFRQ